MAQARNEVLDRVVERAWKDEDFKKQLLSDPRAAFENETGIKIPNDVEVLVHADTPKKLNIVLPINPSQSYQHSLSDEQLDAVAGGASWGCFSP